MRHTAAALMAGLAALPATAQTIPSTPPPAPPQVSPGGIWAPRQAPGYYRFELGAFEIIALLDGTHPFPATELAVGAKPGEVADLLGQAFLTSRSRAVSAPSSSACRASWC